MVQKTNSREELMEALVMMPHVSYIIKLSLICELPHQVFDITITR
jgi:hypothetical protein